MATALDHLRPSAHHARHATLGTAGRLWTAHRASAVIVVPLAILAAVVQAVNMTGFPIHVDDEGTYTAQAYAVQHFGSLTHYTYWYDHPPLGWVQMAFYTWLTDAFGRYPHAVDAGREFMVVTQVVSVVLLWVLCRRLHFARWSAALAVVLFAFSPLAVQSHRSVYLDNIATPWLIAALVLALSPQRRLSAYVGSALCFAVAVLTKETSLLMLPSLALLLWRTTRYTGCRRYALTLAAMTFALTTAGYVAYALVKNELISGPGHVSLWYGVKFQLFSRPGNGSILQPGTRGYDLVHSWLYLDSPFIVTALIGTVVAVFVGRLRPFAIGLLVLVAMMFKPGGYLPVPYVIGMLPLAAVVLAGLADTAAYWRPARWKTGRPRPTRRYSPLAAVVAVALIAFAVVAAPVWSDRLAAALDSRPNAPVEASTAWIVTHVPHTARLAVDDAYWVDLVRAGFPRDKVVWYYKMSTDPEVEKRVPRGWRDYSYLVLTESIRNDPAQLSALDEALRHSRVVAHFGTGPQQIVVRQVTP